MKKMTNLALMLGFFILITPAFANADPAATGDTSTTANGASTPIMRGEYPPIILPDAINIAISPIAGLPTPQAAIADVVLMPTVLIAQTTSPNSDKIDSTLIDDFIDDVSPNARHYPPNFPNRTAQYFTGQNIKHLAAWLAPFADKKNASFEVLLRAAKINGMGRNMDLGSDYGMRASTYLAKALVLQPNHAEANFLYGMMLSEGGGFKEGKKYLNKAAAQGFAEAEQSLAQADLLSDNRKNALKRLQQLQNKYPNNRQIAEQIATVKNGGYYIWDIKDNNLNVKPVNR